MSSVLSCALHQPFVIKLVHFPLMFFLPSLSLFFPQSAQHRSTTTTSTFSSSGDVERAFVVAVEVAFVVVAGPRELPSKG